MSISASSVTLVAGFNSPVKPNTGPTGTGVFGARMISGGGISQPLGSGARARVTDPIWGGVRRWLARRPWPAPSPAVRGRARFPTPWFKGLAFQFPPAGFGTMRSGTREWRGFRRRGRATGRRRNWHMISHNRRSCLVHYRLAMVATPWRLGASPPKSHGGSTAEQHMPDDRRVAATTLDGGFGCMIFTRPTAPTAIGTF